MARPQGGGLMAMSYLAPWGNELLLEGALKAICLERPARWCRRADLFHGNRENGEGRRSALLKRPAGGGVHASGRGVPRETAYQGPRTDP